MIILECDGIDPFSQKRIQLPIDCYGDINILWTNQRTQHIVEDIATEMDGMDKEPFFSFERAIQRAEEAIRENKRLDTGEDEFLYKPSSSYAIPSSFIHVTWIVCLHDLNDSHSWLVSFLGVCGMEGKDPTSLLPSTHLDPETVNSDNTQSLHLANKKYVKEEMGTLCDDFEWVCAMSGVFTNGAL